jgi:tRNA (Thr-GGU) A37 N-methylase
MAQIAGQVEQPLRHNESALLSGIALVFLVILRDGLKQIRQILHVIVLIVVDRAARQIDTSANRLAAALVYQDKITSLGVCRDAG